MGRLKLLVYTCLFMLTAMSANAWYFNMSGTNNSFPRINDSVVFDSYLIAMNASIQSYIFSTNLTGTWINRSFTPGVINNYCYQESANVSTDCGGLGNGSYAWDGIFDLPNYDYYNCFDGILNTNCHSGDANLVSIYINYTKPILATNNSLWQVWSTDSTQSVYPITNYSIPYSCWNKYPDKIVLRITEGGSVFKPTNISCFDGVWNVIFGSSGNPSIYPYEEAMFWQTSRDISTVQNITATKNVSAFSFRFWANDSNGLWNSTGTGNFSLFHYIPITNISLWPKPNVGIGLNVSIGFSDNDSDTWIYNETKWYNGTTYFSNYDNLTSLSAANFTGGGTWTVSVRVKDFFNWSDWVNESVVISDVTAPLINWISVSVITPSTSDSVTFTANVTDSQSIPPASACYFQLKKDDYNLGAAINLSSNSKNGDLISVTINMASVPVLPFGGFGLGVLQFQKAYCQDGSGNWKTGTTDGINITIVAPSSPGNGGGGGSATAVAECSIDKDCEKYGIDYYCVVQKCVKLSRDDMAQINLLKRGLDSTTIQFLIDKGAGVCDWNGVCDLVDGESSANCGTETFPDENLVVQGDCTGVEVTYQEGFLIGTFILGIVGVYLLYKKNKK
jgi:hypothetical protein